MGAAGRLGGHQVGAVKEPCYTQRNTEGAMKLTALIEREGDGYVSLCPELDVASQGKTIEEARDNLREALELFLESASPDEIKQRLRSEVFGQNNTRCRTRC